MSIAPTDKRGPGRPPLTEQVKKGRASWKPSSLNEFFNKDPDYRYRMCRNDPANLAKKSAEGWETVSGITNPELKHDEPGRIQDGAKLTSVQQGHDWVLQRIPEELAKERDDYFNNESERRVAGLTAHLRKGMNDKGGGASLHGEIAISSKRGTQIIE